MNVPLLAELERWFHSQCDGDWEHGAGIRISTLDNPGWSLSVDLAGTELETRPYAPASVQRAEDDWFRCSVSEGRFQAFGGPRNLVDLLESFITWAQP